MTAAYRAERHVVHDGMDHSWYGWSPLPERPPLRWPGGAHVAVVVSVAVETGSVVLPEGAWRPPGYPAWRDVSRASLFDYGSRVGYFRLAAMLERCGAAATVPISDPVARAARPVVDHARERGWELVGHGRSADEPLTSRLPAAEERAVLAASRAELELAVGTPPRGWSGPMLSESDSTPGLLAETGYEYVLDWGNDDQPYLMDVAGPAGRLVCLPASIDLCDLLVMGDTAQTPWDFADALIDHLELLVAEAARTGSGRSMTVTLHAHHSGQAFRARHVRRFLARAAELPGVWFATAGEVLDAFREGTSVPDA